VWGAYALDTATGKVEAHVARATIMASGGAGRVYQFSTAPRGATGDGIAMAWRAGCRVSNMEMMQFHPTCLYNLEVKNFLITEAVRGEGGHLKHPITGHRFMPDYDQRAELAPRDVVARAIDEQIKRFGLDFVHLDISHMPAEFVIGHFPNIHEKLLGLGIDMTKEPIPVVPAQHYTCGGILIGLDARSRPSGPVGRGRVHRERPPRRQPPRLELAARMLRVRRSRGAGRARVLGRSRPGSADPRVGREPGDRV
jgi:L-aspartate oxidase